MKIAILKENKNEYRVALVPADVKTLVANKHEVVITKAAGVNAGFNDGDYLTAGAKIVASNKEAISNSNIILKISKPTNSEFKYISPSQLLVSIFNLANNPQVLAKLLKLSQLTLAIEAIQEDGVFSLIIPNEQIKGRFGALLGCYHLSKLEKFGLGKTFANIDHNQDKAQFTIINASYAGLEAAKTVLGLGANLTILENNDHLAKQIKDDHHLQTLAKLNNAEFKVIKADYQDLSEIVTVSDVLINTNSVPGSLTSKRLTQKMVSTMRPGSVIVDLAIDQGNASDTEKAPSTFKKPYYIVEGVKHFAIENIPSLFANSISVSLSGILTNKLLENLKGESILTCLKDNHILLNAITTYNGKLTNKIVADALHLDYKDIQTLLK
jgi:alanine dehydrogenase